jgi:predicted secreted Zn-dependent protease
MIKRTCFCLMLFSNAAHAKIADHTSYNYFQISGKSAAQIYKSLLSHAKGPGGNDAYATTSTQISQKGSYNEVRGCKVKTYDTFLTFKINLPRLNTSERPSGIVNAKWQGFASMLKRHEEHHRQLWMACATSFNNRVMAMRESTCGALQVRFKALWETTQASCRKQNDAFDTAEKARFTSQPFIQMVMNGN